MHITVVICTHNRADLLERTISYLNNAVTPEGYDVDILVVANACTDRTVQFLEGYRNRSTTLGQLPLIWTEESVPGKSHALNRALGMLKCDAVAFVDDDHRVDTNYLNELCKALHKKTEADIFCGRILPDWNGSEPPWVHEKGPYRIYPLPIPHFDLGCTAKRLSPDLGLPGGGNLAIRTNWLHKVGKFATELGPQGHDLGGSEDSDWVLRAIDKGARLQYWPGMVQYHYVDTSRLALSYLMKKAYKRSASTIRVRKGASQTRIPAYLYRKVAVYLIRAITAWNRDRRRFFLVRTAAALGEMAGYRSKQASHTGHL